MDALEHPGEAPEAPRWRLVAVRGSAVYVTCTRHDDGDFAQLDPRDVARWRAGLRARAERGAPVPPRGGGAGATARRGV